MPLLQQHNALQVVSNRCTSHGVCCLARSATYLAWQGQAVASLVEQICYS